MPNIKNIHAKPIFALVKALKKELRDQGHYNTGQLDASFASETTLNGDEIRTVGTILEYGGILSDGTRPERASMKQFYFVKQYFISKGIADKLAGSYAAATIKKWMVEGMSTKKSARFSRNGRRLNFIGVVDQIIDEEFKKLIFVAVDDVVNEQFNKTKSETI